MIRHILFSSNEAFKLNEFVLRAERYMPAPFDLIIDCKGNDVSEAAYDKVISELYLEDRFGSIQKMDGGSIADAVNDVMEGYDPEDIVCLITTDEMLVDVVDENAIEEAFKEKMLMAFSLRLGKNITKNSMVGMANLVVPVREDDTIMVWDWDKHYVDFSGPLSVHGHYFRVKEIARMIKRAGGSSYDELEENLQVFMNFPKKLMASFVQNKAYSIDPLLHGTHREDVSRAAEKRLLDNNPVAIEVSGEHNEIHFNPFLELMSELYAWQRSPILFKFPARGRRDKLLTTLKAYHEHLINKEDFQFLISIDEDDLELNNDETRAALEANKNTKVVVGPSIGKIGAVNRDMDQAAPWDIVVLLSDDMIPKIKGFDMLIRKDMHKAFPDGDGVLWYNDGHQGDKLNTLCILGKKYYDRFGWIYYPGYKSLFSDNEFMETSQRLGRVKYNSLCIIEHQHWVWGYGAMDDLYIENEKYFKEDSELFQKRMAENFGLTA